MNKQEFLTAIASAAGELPQSDVQKSLDYYSEMIDDAIEDGLTEEEAVAGMDSPINIAGQIAAELPLSSLMKAKVKPRRSLQVWEILLLILGAPVWLPLLFAAIILLLAFFLVLWAMLLSVYCIVLSCAVGAVSGIGYAGAALFTGNMVTAAFYGGMGIFLFGLSILLFFGCNQGAAGLIALHKLLLRQLKTQFVKKENQQ